MPKALPIKTLPLGEKISEAGAYDIPLFRYHSDICSAPSVSSSEISQIANNGEIYYSRSKYNPEFKPLEEYKAHKRRFNFANAAHARLLLGPKDWHKEDFILIPKKWNGKTFRTRELSEWVWLQEVRKGLICIFESEVDAVDAMAKRVEEHPEAKALLQYGLPEITLCHKIGDIWVKARPDILPVRPVDAKGKIIRKRELITSATKFAFASDVQTDYKTIFDNSPMLCRQAIGKYGYDMKLANVALAAVRLFGIDFSALSFGLVFQSTSPPYGITAVEIDPLGDYMHLLVAKAIYGARQFEKGMSFGGEWEGYVSEILRYTPSGYFMDDLKKLVEDGTYPNLDGKLRVIEGGA